MKARCAVWGWRMDLEHRAIERLRLAAEMSETYYGQPLVITTSGGKDSDVCLYLAAASGIRYEVMHNHTAWTHLRPYTTCVSNSGVWNRMV